MDKKTRACWYRVVTGYTMGKEDLSKWRMGDFHAWSTFHEEYESGPGPFPAAIVEDNKTGAVIVTFAGNVHFGADPETKP